MKFHPLCDIFPGLSDTEFSSLKSDIERNGVLNSIHIYEGQILDGKHRFLACKELDIVCPSSEYTGTDPLQFVLSLNLKRRHLDASQRAMVAARIANMKQGERTDLTENSVKLSQESAAKTLNVSIDSVQFAKKVQEQATPEIIEQVERGNMPVSQAAKLADSTPEFQRRVVEKLTSGETTKTTDAIRRVKHEDRPNIESPSGKYRVIYADPPWRYGNSGDVVYGNAEDQYPTMSIEELCALPIEDSADDSAVLFLWVTSPLLAECFEVIKAWGFQYKTSIIWNKESHNFGYYVSVQHELLLICTRGSCTPDIKELLPSVVSIKKSKTHSEKPEEFRAMIDKMYPHGARIELFGRKEVENWKVWGNEPAKQL